MATLRSVALGALVLLLLACSGAELRPVVTDLNTGIDFRLYKSYRWFDGPFFEGNAATAVEGVYVTLRDAINEKLTASGLEWKQFDDVDLTMHIHAGMKTKPPVEQWTAYNWYKPWWGAFTPLVAVSGYDAGSLVIDIIDVKKVELIWRSVLPSVFNDDGNVTDMQRFRAQLDEAFMDFPIHRQIL
jgi:hypothetical protein